MLNNVRFFNLQPTQKSKLCIVLNLPLLHLKEVRLLELILLLTENISGLISYILLRFCVHTLTKICDADGTITQADLRTLKRTRNCLQKMSVLKQMYTEL